MKHFRWLLAIAIFLALAYAAIYFTLLIIAHK